MTIKRNKNNEHLLVLPSPALVKRQAGFYPLPTKLTLSCEVKGPLLTTVRKELRAGTAGVGQTAAIRCTIATPGNNPHLAHPEGYRLKISLSGIEITASAEAGLLYAAMTLQQLQTQYGNKLPCMTIEDSPKLSRRGIQVCFPQGHTGYRDTHMRYMVRQLAKFKINELYLYLESYFDFPSLPHMAGPEAMTAAQAKSLDRLCQSYNIKLIPMLNALAHAGEILSTQRFQHLTEHPADQDRRTVRPFNLCASSPEVTTLVDGMLDDMVDCFSADLIHVGGDEVSCLGECPRCQAQGANQQSKMELYTHYFGRILTKLKAHGRKGGIWGDMLLQHVKKENAAKQKTLLEPLGNNVVIFDWQYAGGNTEPLTFFKAHGLETIACSTTHLCYTSFVAPAQSYNQRELFMAAIETHCDGGLTTAWGNMNGNHEELYTYLQCSTAGLLWSGAKKTSYIGDASLEQFEAAYSLQRYGIKGTLFTDYIHLLGDLSGPVLGPMEPFHGAYLRKLIYQSDNILLFWQKFCSRLTPKTFIAYQREIGKARRLWTRLQKAKGPKAHPYFKYFEGPLIMHEHLIARFVAAEEAYTHYDIAAKEQYRNDTRFKEELDQVAAIFTQLLKAFSPIERFYASGRKRLGFDRSSQNRIKATKDKTRELIAYLKHLKNSHRPLPAFLHLSTGFLETERTNWCGNREHDWAHEPERFQRYSLVPDKPWEIWEISAKREQEMQAFCEAQSRRRAH